MDDREKLIELIGNIQHHGHMERRDANGVWVWLPPNEKLADYLIANGVTVQKWIPVTERLPEKEDVFLCWSKDLADMMFCFTSDFKQMEVTHWMPLPEQPATEVEE